MVCARLETSTCKILGVDVACIEGKGAGVWKVCEKLDSIIGYFAVVDWRIVFLKGLDFTEEESYNNVDWSLTSR